MVPDRSRHSQGSRLYRVYVPWTIRKPISVKVTSDNGRGSVTAIEVLKLE